MDERRNQQDRQQQQQQQQQSEAGVSGLGDSDAARRAGQQRAQQQGDQSGTRQQQQFDRGTSQQSGGSATTSRFADQIREHMEVVDDMGRHCGTVDHVEGDRIKLARSDSPDGKHHYVAMSQVAGIKDGKVCLRERGDNDFGMESGA